MRLFSVLSGLNEMDLKTPENRAIARRKIQEFMKGQFAQALLAYRNLSRAEREWAEGLVEKWQFIITRIKTRSEALGYSEACIQHIPVCKGECCKWHFPKKIDDVQFFVSMVRLSEGDIQQLAELLDNNSHSAYQCPVLLEDGCFLSFENRPVICSSAYPCFAQKAYHDYLNVEKRELGKIYDDIEQMINNLHT